MYSELVRAIEHGTDVLLLTTHLLRLCRDHLADLQKLDSEASLWSERDRLRRRCEQFFRAVDDEELDVEEQDTLCKIALEHSQTLPAVIIAHAIAEALDLVLGTRLLPMFVGRKVVLQPGDPIPLPHPDWRRLASVPDDLVDHPGIDLGATSHVRLAQEWANEVRVTIDGDWRRWHVLPQIRRGDRLACAIPNDSLSELALGCDEAAPGSPPAGPGLDANEQTRRCLALLELARVHECRFVIFPALGIGEPVRLAMQAWLEAQNVVELIAAGDCQMPADSEQRCNKAWIHVRGLCSPMVHRTFCPLLFLDPSSSTPGLPARCHEYMATGSPALTVHLSPHWTSVLLLGVDAIAEPVPDVLADVHANLVLVPALAFHMDEFCALAETLAARCQAITLVANACLARQPGAARPPLVMGLPTHLGGVIAQAPPSRSLVVVTIGSLARKPSTITCPESSG